MKKLILSLTLALLTTVGWSQCNASFQTSISNDTVTIINTSTSSNSGVFVWTMTGGSPSSAYTYDTTTSVVTQYNTTGAYTICVVMYDSNWSCSDTFCDSIYVTGSGSSLSSSVSSTNTACGACNGSATVTATGGTSPYSYLWSNAATTATISSLCAGTYGVTVVDNNGDTVHNTVAITGTGGVTVDAGQNYSGCAPDSVLLTASVNATGAHTYLWSNGASTQSTVVNSTGVYYVTATDSNGCTGTDSVIVTLNSGPSLSTSSTNETCTSCCNGTATATATGTGLSYAWSNSATTSSISSLCPGTYTVTVTDTLTGCSSISSTVVSAYTASCYNIGGTVSQGALARVYLIQHNTGTLTAVDSVQTDSNGYYEFNNVCNGTYHVKAALLPTHVFYAIYIPTYYDSASLWAYSTSIVVNSASIYNVNVTMLSGANFGGAGFVGGLITQGANRGEGDPVAGVYVSVYNEDGSLAAFDQTDANGAYAIDNLANGTYEIHVDVLNRISYPHIAVISDDNFEFTNKDFEVHSTYIKPLTPAGINDASHSAFEVYPNPTDGNININPGDVQLNSISLINILGERVIQETITTEGIVEVDLSTLAPGSYILELNGESGNSYQTVIVK